MSKSAMTKEEILKNNRRGFDRSDYRAVLSAMDEYAKQQAIAFTKHYLQSAVKDNMGIATDAGPNDRLSERYDKFIEQQNKQQ